MKVSCDIIGDLLPLVAENMASEASRKLVEEHIMDCPACREQYERLKKHDSVETAIPQDGEMALGAVKEEIRHRRRNSVLLVACLVFLVVFTVFSQLTAPQYLPYSEGLLSIEESADGTVYGTARSVRIVGQTADPYILQRDAAAGRGDSRAVQYARLSLLRRDL